MKAWLVRLAGLLDLLLGLAIVLLTAWMSLWLIWAKVEGTGKVQSANAVWIGIGCVMMLTGAGLLLHQTWGRVVGILIAVVYLALCVAFFNQQSINFEVEREAFKARLVIATGLAQAYVLLVLIVAWKVAKPTRSTKERDAKLSTIKARRGSALLEQKRYAEAESEFREAIRLDPDYSCYQALGVCVYMQGRSSEAASAYREALKLKPNNAITHYNLGQALKAQQLYAEAESEFREAIRLNPSDPDFFIQLEKSLAAQKKYAEAESALREAERLVKE